MGIGAGIIELYRQLDERMFFADKKSVLELGSQEIMLRNEPNRPAKELYKKYGLLYRCIDPNDEHGALHIDLNYVCYQDVQ